MYASKVFWLSKNLIMSKKKEKNAEFVRRIQSGSTQNKDCWMFVRSVITNIFGKNHDRSSKNRKTLVISQEPTLLGCQA